MKHSCRAYSFLLIAGISSLLAGVAEAAKTLAVPNVSQKPQSNWCWAATSEAVLRYTQNAPGMCTIANYARIARGWGDDNCCTNPTGSICNRANAMSGTAGSLQSILSNWGAPSEKAGVLTLSQVTDNLDDDAPMIVGWRWTNGGGHVVVLHGYSGTTMTVMDPWDGPTSMSYSALRSTSARRWTDTLIIRPLKITYVVDDTGSMSDEIASVRSTLLSQINGYSTAGRFVKYTLVTYKDSVNFVGSTTDSSTIRGWVNALSASGGGDCPEEGYGALDEAASRAPRSEIWWMTDADSHGGSLRLLLTRARLLLARCTLHSTILGACTVPGSVHTQSGSGGVSATDIDLSLTQPAADVSAFTAAEVLSTATGGLFFTTSSADIDDVTRIITEEMDSDAFLARRSRPAGTSVSTVPVDASVQELKVTFDVSAGATGALSVKRPSGVVLTPGEAGVTEIVAGQSRMLLVSAPALSAGSFEITTTSTKASFLSVSGASPHRLELASDATIGAGVPFAVKVVIPSLAPQTGPVGPGPDGPGGELPPSPPGPALFQYDRTKLKFFVEAEDGSGRHEISLFDDGVHDDGDPLDGVFGGPLSLADAGRYRIVANIAASSFERIATVLVAAARVSISGPADNVARPGTTNSRSFTIKNLGTGTKTFLLGVSSAPAWADTSSTPSSITLAAGASSSVAIPVQVPPTAVRGDAAVLSVTVAADDDPVVTDSAFAKTDVWSGPLLQNISGSPASRGGTLTLSGSGFGADPGAGHRSSDAAHVLFSGARVVDANFISWRDDEIKIIVPSNAVSGLALVVAGAEESNALPVTIIVQAVSLAISKSASAAAPSGSLLTYTITYGNSGDTAATAVVISDTIPAGSTFVSATNGGTFASGIVTWNIGTLPAGSTGLTVSFTVQVTAAQGATLTNDTYSIEAAAVPAISGAPVVTAVTAANASGVPTASETALAILAALLAAIGMTIIGRMHE